MSNEISKKLKVVGLSIGNDLHITHEIKGEHRKIKYQEAPLESFYEALDSLKEILIKSIGHIKLLSESKSYLRNIVIKGNGDDKSVQGIIWFKSAYGRYVPIKTPLISLNKTPNIFSISNYHELVYIALESMISECSLYIRGDRLQARFEFAMDGDGEDENEDHPDQTTIGFTENNHQWSK